MKEYTEEMRAKNEPCPYCGFWHSASSHPPQFNFYVSEIMNLENELEQYKKIYNIVASRLGSQNYKLLRIKDILEEVYTNDLDNLNEGEVVILFWSDNSYSLSTWSADKLSQNPRPIGWYENTDENYWKYIGSKGFE